MLEELKERVCKANLMLRDSGLVILTWGNASAIDRESGLIVIKPSGVSYDELTPDKMVVVNMDGNVVEGDLRPSSDTPTHIALYQSFEEIGGIVHTHSRYATIWAQAGLDIVAYGTTHADYFYGDVPCTMPLEESQIVEDYEKNTGYAIADTFARRRIGCMEIPACLVAHHGPFTWGATLEDAVENAIVLEEVAHMAVFNTNFQFGLTRIQETLLDKHYLRKHGENAYYGQTIGSVTALDPTKGEMPDTDGEIQIAPSNHTVELKNISQIGEVARPVVNKPPKKEEEVFKFDDSVAEDAGADMSGDMGMPAGDMDLSADGMDMPSDDFEIKPAEPDAPGEPLMPLESEFFPVDNKPAPKPDDSTPSEPYSFTRVSNLSSEQFDKAVERELGLKRVNAAPKSGPSPDPIPASFAPAPAPAPAPVSEPAPIPAAPAQAPAASALPPLPSMPSEPLEPLDFTF